MIAPFLLAIPNGIAWLAGPRASFSDIRIMMFVFSLSMLGFLAYRFYAVQTALAEGRLSPDDFRRDPQAHLMGRRAYIYALAVANVIVATTIFLYEKLSGHFFGAT